MCCYFVRDVILFLTVAYITSLTDIGIYSSRKTLKYRAIAHKRIPMSQAKCPVAIISAET